jgi:hypothetical protein
MRPGQSPASNWHVLGPRICHAFYRVMAGVSLKDCVNSLSFFARRRVATRGSGVGVGRWVELVDAIVPDDER